MEHYRPLFVTIAKIKLEKKCKWIPFLNFKPKHNTLETHRGRKAAWSPKTLFIISDSTSWYNLLSTAKQHFGRINTTGLAGQTPRRLQVNEPFINTKPHSEMGACPKCFDRRQTMALLYAMHNLSLIRKLFFFLPLTWGISRGWGFSLQLSNTIPSTWEEKTYSVKGMKLHFSIIMACSQAVHQLWLCVIKEGTEGAVLNLSPWSAPTSPTMVKKLGSF